MPSLKFRLTEDGQVFTVTLCRTLAAGGGRKFHSRHLDGSSPYILRYLRPDGSSCYTDLDGAPIDLSGVATADDNGPYPARVVAAAIQSFGGMALFANAVTVELTP